MVSPPYLTDESLSEFIRTALREDIGDGDHSAMGAVPSDRQASARLLVKEVGIVAGVQLAQHIFRQADPDLKVDIHINDGQPIQPGDVVLLVTGAARSILSAERLVLNCMQRMSGIATQTRKLSSLLEGTRARLMDTRKTTPNFRLPEKWAVAIGGGMNHRFGLYDMIMIKDNHVDLAGGIREAIMNVRHYLPGAGRNLRVEIEVRNLAELDEVLATGGVDIIMLDNMTTAMMREAVARVAGRFKTEASGGITAANLREVAETGVDYISVGALTHSVKSLDLSLKVVKQ